MSFVFPESHHDTPKRKVGLAGLLWMLVGGCEALFAGRVYRDLTRARPYPLAAMPVLCTVAS